MSIPETNKFQVWFIPTAKGVKSFGWKEQRIGGTDLMGREEAQYEAYMANSDDPAPDKAEFGACKVLELPNKD